MQTLSENTTDLKAEHCNCVSAIDAALTSLQDALTGEKEFRRKCQRDHSEFHANLPALKFPIVLSKNQSKPFQFIAEWRTWARGCGCLVEGDE